MNKDNKRSKHTVYLALGANNGDRRANLSRAIQELADVVSIQEISSIYETDPIGYLEQARFLNLVCVGETEVEPQELLSRIKGIEKTVGRIPTFRNGPREIDIDILLYDSIELDEKNLTIPHPRMLERSFVLAPLAELSPALIPPGSTETINTYFQRLPRQGIEKLPAKLEIERN